MNELELQTRLLMAEDALADNDPLFAGELLRDLRNDRRESPDELTTLRLELASMRARQDVLAQALHEALAALEALEETV